MDVLKNENNKESIVTFQDFPFICRICCLKRSDLRLFEEEYYLWDLFHTIRRIDVFSRVNFPKNVCDECINKLQDISGCIDNLKYNHESFGSEKNPKRLNVEESEEMEREMSLRSVETTDENDDMSIQGSQICRICFFPAISLTPFDEMIHLVQMFQNITNIDVEAEFNSSKMNGICSKCNNELEKISSFAYYSMCNDQKLDNVIERGKVVKIEIYSNRIDIESSMYQECKLESFVDRNEATTENASEENSFFLEREEKLEIIDIKEELIDSEPANSTEQNHSKGTYIHSQTFPKKEPIDGSSYLKPLEKESYSSLQLRNPDKDLDLDLTTQSGNELFKCDSFKSSLVRHPLSPTGKKSPRYDCCENTFTNKQSLPFKCDHCEKAFIYEKRLQEHIVTHTGEKPFKCDCCEKRFTLKSSLVRHSLSHTGKKSLRCDCCDKSFIRKYLLVQHLVTHTTQRPFKCDGCEKTFTNNQTLQQHIYTHSGEKPFKCDSCGKRFALKSSLVRHSLSHTNKKSFGCNCCEKRFNRNYLLQQHLLTHTTEKPFECDSCEKGFARKSSLARHSLSHAGKTSL